MRKKRSIPVMRTKLCSTLILLLSFTGNLEHGLCDIGTAAVNTGIPNLCFGGGGGDYLPADNFIATVNEAIWNGGSMCGMRFELACLSGNRKRPCKNRTITVVVVDVCHERTCPNFKLSPNAFTAISKYEWAKIRIDYVML